jgi:hypothetical protein
MKMPSFETLDAVWNWSLADALGWKGFLIWFVGALVMAVGLALWRKRKETVGLGVLFLLGLLSADAQDVNSIFMNRERFIQIEVDRCIEEAAKTDEVKHLRGQFFLAKQGNDIETMGKLAERLEVIKRTVAANATIQASEQWETIQKAQTVAAVAPTLVTMSRERSKELGDQLNQPMLDQAARDEHLWLLRQQVMIEAEKLRLMQSR